MARAVAVDVVHGLVQVGHHPHDQRQVQELRAPVALRRRLDALGEHPAARAAEQAHAFLFERRDHLRQEGAGDGAVHQQPFQGVAHPRPLYLGVENNTHRHVHVGVLIDKGVAHALVVLEHRDARFLGDRADQPLAAAGDDQVNGLLLLEEHVDALPVGERQHLDDGRIHLVADEHLLQHRGQGQVGADRLGAAAQDDRVAGLEAEGGGVDGHVRPGLVDHADHAERDPHATDGDTARPAAHLVDLAHRVVQGGDLAQAADHIGDALRADLQPVAHGRGDAARVRRSQVPLVLGEQVVLTRQQRLTHVEQDAVLHRGRQGADDPGRSPGLPGHIENDRFYLRAFHVFSCWVVVRWSRPAHPRAADNAAATMPGTGPVVK